MGTSGAKGGSPRAGRGCAGKGWPFERSSGPTEKQALSYRESLKERKKKKKREREQGKKIPRQVTGGPANPRAAPVTAASPQAVPRARRRTQGCLALSPQAEHATAPAPRRTPPCQVSRGRRGLNFLPMALGPPR